MQLNPKSVRGTVWPMVPLSAIPLLIACSSDCLRLSCGLKPIDLIVALGSHDQVNDTDAEGLDAKRIGGTEPSGDTDPQKPFYEMYPNLRTM